MAGFFDTSGLDNDIYGGTTNNAGSDYTRLNADNPGQFSGGVFDRLFGGKSKKEIQTQALAATTAPDPVTPPVTPEKPTPASPTKVADAPSGSDGSLSSGPGLVRRILGQLTGGPTHNDKGEALVPGTPFTLPQFMEKLQKVLAPPPKMPGMPEMNALGVPKAGLQAPPAPPQSAAPPPTPPQAPPMAMHQPPRPPSAQGPAMYGGPMANTPFAGGPTNAVATPVSAPQSQPSGADAILAAQQRYLQQNVGGQSRGYFHGGAIDFMRGGYPANLMMGLPERHAHQGPVPDGSGGDGRSDHVEARLSPGEFVQDAETVALLGNGSSDAGARGMEAIRQEIRKDKGKALAQGKFSPNAKKPGYYAQVGMRAASRGRS